MMTKIKDAIKKAIDKVTAGIKDMFTEADNHTADIGCVLFCAIVATYCFCSVYATVKYQQAFDWQGAGVGAGAILTGAGVLFGLKKQAAGGGNDNTDSD